MRERRGHVLLEIEDGAMTKETLGAVLDRLAATIEKRCGASAGASYTASLLSGGAARCAKKFGEEAVEAVIAGAGGDRAALGEEAADVLYHLLVLMAGVGVTPDEVAGILARREALSGHAEKASRGE